MPLGSKTIVRSLEVALEAGSRAKKYGALIEAKFLQDFAPYFDEGKAPPDLRYFLELLGREMDALSEELSTSDYNRQAQASSIGFQKDRERVAAKRVRTLLADVRYFLDRTVGKVKAKQNFEGRDGLSRLPSPILLRVGERLVNLLRDETIGWDRYPEINHLTSRTLLSTELETALAGFKQELGASRPDRADLSLTTNTWKRDLEEKVKRLGNERRLLQAFLIGAGFELEAAELTPRPRKSTPAKEEGPGGEEGTKVAGMSGGSEVVSWPGMKPGVGAVLVAPGPESAASQCN